MTENPQPEKLELTSLDIAAEKQAELLCLFPEARTEGGKIDFDRLRLALGETVDAGKERYSMNWPGKADSFKAIQRPSLGTLLPVREESVNFDETENLIIEGDNLEVLKLLQKSYQGKVKMIYIDPPYNTGNDFIYPDNYSESLQTYLEYTGQVDSEGRRFSNNLESDGRFHSKWLSMMYPRLYLARNLLREDGVIFVSIDDKEQVNLQMILNEIFGPENFAAWFVVKSNPRGSQSTSMSASVHEYIACYARSADVVEALSLPLEERMIDEYSKQDKDGNYRLLGLRQRGGFWRQSDRPLLHYPLYVSEADNSVSIEKSTTHTISVSPFQPSTGIAASWRWGKEKVKKDSKFLVARKVARDGGEAWDIFQKDYLSSSDGVEKETKPKTIWDEKDVNTQNGTTEVKELFKGAELFDFPKPVNLVKKCLSIGTDAEGGQIVIDFFAGSGTTAQALLELNKEDGGNRKFILVQLPEPTKRDDFKTIADITKERVRRVIQRHEMKSEGKLNLNNSIKEGFRTLKLASSNFTVWNASTEATDEKALQQQLELHVEHIVKGRYSEDLLYEVLLKSGFPLTTPVETLGIEGKAVYSVADGAMLICLDKELTHETIKAIADLKPERVVCLDEGFAGNDQLKTNAVLIMKSKGVTKFQTI